MRVIAALPAVALVGEREVIVGRGLLTVKLTAVEVPPPGPGLVTVTGNVPACAMSAAVMVAVSRVLLEKVVVRAEPFQFTVAPLTNLLPVAVRVKATEPSVLLFGEIEVSTAAELLMEKLSVLEVPPPGAGLDTLTFAVPADAMSAAVIVAVSCVTPTKLVVRDWPFHSTLDPFTKFVPFTVNVKAAPPAVALVGESEVAVGTGLLTENARKLEVCPLDELNTVTDGEPAVATSAAGTVAVSWVLLTNVEVRFTPFQRTTEVESKFAPVTVKVNAALPAVLLEGESEEIETTGSRDATFMSHTPRPCVAARKVKVAG